MVYGLKKKTLSLFKTSAVFGMAAAGFFYVTSQSSAQRAGGERPSRFMDRIDAEEGAIRLADFRRQRLKGDFCFKFELEHKPRRARTTRYEGIMWGSWNKMGPVTRVRVSPQTGNSASSAGVAQGVELIIQNGSHPQAWIRHSDTDAFEEIKGEALFDPILPDLLYAPFDLQMPFIYWDDFVYEGPTLVGATRVAQQFLMLPPELSASAELGIEGVRVGLDDTYNALWRIEVVNTGGEVASRFAVESFKKVQDQYIVKRITQTDYPSKDRTTFDVEAAAVGLTLERDVFNPLAAEVVLPNVREKMEKL